MVYFNFLFQLPGSIQKYFQGRKKLTEGAQLVLDIFNLRKEGIFYDRSISLRLFNYITNIKGEQYLVLVNYIKGYLNSYGLTNYVGSPDEIISMLSESLSRPTGRIWDYEKISFLEFSTKAAHSIMFIIYKKMKPEIIDIVPPDEDDAKACNLVEYSADYHAQPHDKILEEQEEVDSYMERLRKTDRIAYNVLLLRFDHYTYPEIVEELHLSEQQVENARRRFRKLYKKYFRKS